LRGDAFVPFSQTYIVTRAVVGACAVALLLLGGCPGRIDDPTPFFASDHDGEMLPCGMAETCSGSVCHSGGDPAAELDMVSTNLAARLVDVPSSMCEGRLLVDSQNPEASFFLEKVRASDPECGAPMPFIGDPMNADEIACVEDFIHSLLSAVPADASMPPADAGGSQ
jgi:hypothetical protein